tara:strand:- start:21244 stop:22161 length:918 start_codon:yes stop_codon:yes gene_type:complete
MRLALCFILPLILASTPVSAKLLDKIVAVVDEQVIPLSLVRRLRSNAAARAQISPYIYQRGAKITHKEAINIIIHRSLVRDKLAEMGYVISDDQVESQIKSTEQRLGLGRQALLNFLKGNGMTFDEYFELIRETIEHNIFNDRVIRPLISVTEQEIKNAFYKENQNNKSISFKYTLVDFALDDTKLSKKSERRFKEALKSFQVSGSLPDEFKDVETTTLGDITEEGLTNELKQLLKRTDEGAFTNSIRLGSTTHVFYVQKKDLVESEIFLKHKDRIRAKLFEQVAGEITGLWFERESNKHYIRRF